MKSDLAHGLIVFSLINPNDNCYCMPSTKLNILFCVRLSLYLKGHGHGDFAICW